MILGKCPNCCETYSGNNGKCNTFGCFHEINAADYNNYLDNIELCKEISKIIFSPFIDKLPSTLKEIENRMIHHPFNFDKNIDEILLIESLIKDIDGAFYPVYPSIKNFHLIVFAKENINKYSFENNYIMFAYVDLFFVKFEIISSIHDKYVTINNVEYGFVTENDSIKRSDKRHLLNDVELVFNNVTEKYRFECKRILKGDLSKMLKESKKLELYKGLGQKVDKNYAEVFKNNITTCLNSMSHLSEDKKSLNKMLLKQEKALFKNKKKINDLKQQTMEISKKIYNEHNKIIEYYKQLIVDLKS